MHHNRSVLIQLRLILSFEWDSSVTHKRISVNTAVHNTNILKRGWNAFKRETSFWKSVRTKQFSASFSYGRIDNNHVRGTITSATLYGTGAAVWTSCPPPNLDGGGPFSPAFFFIVLFVFPPTMAPFRTRTVMHTQVYTSCITVHNETKNCNNKKPPSKRLSTP